MSQTRRHYTKDSTQSEAYPKLTVLTIAFHNS
jgi:hypothetical protein